MPSPRGANGFSATPSPRSDAAQLVVEQAMVPVGGLISRLGDVALAAAGAPAPPLALHESRLGEVALVVAEQPPPPKPPPISRRGDMPLPGLTALAAVPAPTPPGRLVKPWFSLAAAAAALAKACGITRWHGKSREEPRSRSAIRGVRPTRHGCALKPAPPASPAAPEAIEAPVEYFGGIALGVKPASICSASASASAAAASASAAASA
mmetsp:Transcript_42849/g.118453  ORF Transcript_42849/g.118453 Transcript_42849/m.118453 type:complete len:209 (+) Transcript_42849:432-1058(+)